MSGQGHSQLDEVLCHIMPTDPVRIAEPWTPTSMFFGVLLAGALLTLVVWLVRRGAES